MAEKSDLKKAFVIAMIKSLYKDGLISLARRNAMIREAERIQ